MQTADLRTGKGLGLVLECMHRVRVRVSVRVKINLGFAAAFYPTAGQQVWFAGSQLRRPHFTRGHSYYVCECRLCCCAQLCPSTSSATSD